MRRYTIARPIFIRYVRHDRNVTFAAARIEKIGKGKGKNCAIIAIVIFANAKLDPRGVAECWGRVSITAADCDPETSTEIYEICFLQQTWRAGETWNHVNVHNASKIFADFISSFNDSVVCRNRC